MYDLQDFLIPIDIHALNEDSGYNDGHIARFIFGCDSELSDLEKVDIVIVGIGETRGGGIFNNGFEAANAIRKQLYQLHYWHFDIRIADFGNIKTGATLNDSYAAIKTVLAELLRMKKNRGIAWWNTRHYTCPIFCLQGIRQISGSHLHRFIDRP